MPFNTDYTRLVDDIRDAMANAADNGFPTDDLTDIELAEDLAGHFDHSVPTLHTAVQIARGYGPIIYHVFADYGFTSEEELIQTEYYPAAVRVFRDHKDEPRRVELARFRHDGEYFVELSNGGPTP